MKKESNVGVYHGKFVSFPEPWDAIMHPGVRLCLGEPVEVLTSFSRHCIPVYTLATDVKLTKTVKSYAHYFHTITGHYRPDVVVSYITVPRFMLALRSDATFRALVCSSPISVAEGY